MLRTDSAPISFNEVREQVGLLPLAGGLPAGLVEVAPANADNLNDAVVARSLVSSAMPSQLATGLPKGVLASDLLQAFSWNSPPNQIVLTPVVDQGVCGCCWAVACVACINDRIAVKTKKNPLFYFQELVACEGTCRLCSTCSVQTGFSYVASSGLTPSGAADDKGFNAVMREHAQLLTDIGMPSGISTTAKGTGRTGGGLLPAAEASTPDNAEKVASSDVCPRTAAVLFAKKTQEKLGGVGQPQRCASILALQHCIMQQGPVVTILRIYTDFIVGSSPGSPPFASTEGIYIHREGKTNYAVEASRNKTLGTHCMVIVGWGISAKGIRYWEVRNSWGTAWGKAGFCKIAMTDGALGNSSVGVDLAIASVKNNITTHRYGNMWVSVDHLHKMPANTYGFGYHLQVGNAFTAETVQASLKLHRAKTALYLVLVGTFLLLLFLSCRWQNCFFFNWFRSLLPHVSCVRIFSR